MAPKRFVPILFDELEDESGAFSGGGGVIVATCNWLARAAETYDVWTFTVSGSPQIGDTYSVKRNGKTVTFTATAATVANVATGLYALLSGLSGAAAEAEFTEYAWTNPSGGVLVATASAGGVPATFTVSKSVAGTGDIAAANTTAATGPNNWNDSNNWEGGAVPGNGDTANVNLDLGAVKYGLAQSAVTLAVLNITGQNANSNSLGLPKINQSGSYTEDRLRALHIGATLVRVDTNSTLLSLKLVGTTTVEARRTGTGQSNVPALLVQTADSSSVFEIDNGEMGLAFYDGETVTAASLYVGQSGKCTGGAGATVTTISNIGSLDYSGTFTTLNQGGNSAIIRGTPGATTITGTGGKVDCRIGGTLTNLSLRACELDKANDLTPLTITNTTLHAGGAINDPQQTITYTNKPAIGAGVKRLVAA